MFAFVFDTIAALGWGLLTASVVALLVAFVANGLFGRFSWNLCNVAAMAVMFVFLVVQSALFAGAGYASEYVSGVSSVVKSMVANGSQALSFAQDNIEAVGRDRADEIKAGICDQFPVLSSYIAAIDTDGLADCDANSIVVSVENSIKERIARYRWRRVWWMLGAVVVLGAAVFATDGSRRAKAGSYTYSAESYSDPDNF